MMHMELKIGQRFGRLTVIERAPDGNDKSKYNAVRYYCRCDCGSVVSVRKNGLISGNTKSCGCLSKEVHSTQKGLISHPLYNIWRGMKKRCYSKTDHAYRNYGGRGITVCEEWKNSFLSFYEWALRSGYNQGLSLDRVDNDKGYSPDNCRWATNTEQGNNRRTNHHLEYNGETLTLAQWQAKTGIRQETIRRRLKNGWSIEDALTVQTGERTRWNR